MNVQFLVSKISLDWNEIFKSAADFHNFFSRIKVEIILQIDHCLQHLAIAS